MYLKVKIPEGDKCQGCCFLEFRDLLVGGLYFCSYFRNFSLNKTKITDNLYFCYKIEECLNSTID